MYIYITKKFDDKKQKFGINAYRDIKKVCYGKDENEITTYILTLNNDFYPICESKEQLLKQIKKEKKKDYEAGYINSHTIIKQNFEESLNRLQSKFHFSKNELFKKDKKTGKFIF
jgi:hypothetical protein